MIDDIASWTAANAPAYYGPAFVAYAVVYKITQDIRLAAGRHMLRGVVFALLLGSKLTISPDGDASVTPLWQTLFTGSAGFAIVGLAFWTIGGFGISQLLDVLHEVLKEASKALRRSVVFAALLVLFGAIGAVVTAPLGRMVDAHLDADGAPVPATAATPTTIAPVASPIAAPASTPAAASTTAPASTPASAPAPLAGDAPASSPDGAPAAAPATKP